MRMPRPPHGVPVVGLFVVGALLVLGMMLVIVVLER